MEHSENDPKLDGKYLGTITQDFVKISETLQDASYQIIKRGFSKYPIFPFCKDEQPIGQLLIPKDRFDIKWNVYATYLDEFTQREIIGDDKVDDFKSTFKDPEEFCCLFIIDGAFTSFVFVPFPMDDNFER